MSKARGQFVAISDLHAHPWSAFSKGGGAENERLQRTLQVLDASLQQAQGLGVPWVFAGDIVHTAGYALNVVLSGVGDVLGAYPDVRKIVVWGNHDARGIGGAITLRETVWAILAQSVELTVLDPSATPMTTAGGLTFAGLGAQPKSTTWLCANSDVGVYHDIVRDSLGPSGYKFTEGIDPDDLLERHRVSVVGDLHHPHFWQPKPGRAILVPGSPEHHNFGDAGVHGWWLVSVGARIKAEFTPSGSPVFLTVDSVGDVKKDGNFYRVRNVGATEQLPDGVAAVAPSPTTVVARAAMSGMSDDEILKAWMAEDVPEGKPDRYFAVGRDLLGAQERVSLRSGHLRALRLVNFGSYADETFPIEPGVHLVLGRGLNYDSNGAGKTTLFESLYWLLTGRTTKGVASNDVIRRGADSCRVEGLADLEGVGKIHIVRSRGKGGHTLTVKDAQGISQVDGSSVNEVTKQLGRYLGVTPELVLALQYFSQSSLTLFSAATDSARKDMVDALIGLLAYQQASTAASVCVSREEQSVREVEARLEVVQENLASEMTRGAEALAAAEAWDAQKAERRQKALDDNEAFAGKAKELEKELVSQKLDKMLSGVRARQDKLEGRKEELLAMQAAELPADDLPSAEEAAANAAEMTALVSEATAANDECVAVANRSGERMRVLNTQNAQREKKFAAGICPTCEQPVDEAHREKCLAPLREEIREAIDVAAKASLAAVKSARTKAEAEGWLAVAVVVEQKVQRISERSVLLKRIEYDLQALVTEEESLEKVAKAEASAALRQEAARLYDLVLAIDREVNPHTSSVLGSRQRIMNAEADIVLLGDKITAHVENRAVYQYWVKGFSRQGIQSLLLDEVAAAFNAARGGIFPSLTQGVYDAQLSTQSLTRGGELREKTEIIVYEHGVLVPYASLSGGEQRRVDVGVMLTLVKAVSEWMHVPGVLGMLVLDEVFSFLDASGAEGLADALREVQETIPSVYVVTHDPQLQALFSSTLMIERGEDGVSRISS